MTFGTSMENISTDVVSIKVTGYGTNVWAYAISNETYDRICQDCGDDDPIDIIMSEYQAGQLVCWGIDASGDCIVTLDVAGASEELKVISLCDGQSLSDELEARNLPTSTPCIGYNSEEPEYLGAVFDLGNLDHVFLDSISWKNITLQLTLPVPASQFDRSKLSLLVCDMDCETELSALTYQNDVLDDLEEDIIGVIYDGKKYFFESECMRSFDQSRCIVSRTDDGWEINEEVDF